MELKALACSRGVEMAYQARLHTTIGSMSVTGAGGL